MENQRKQPNNGNPQRLPKKLIPKDKKLRKEILAMDMAKKQSRRAIETFSMVTKELPGFLEADDGEDLLRVRQKDIANLIPIQNKNKVTSPFLRTTLTSFFPLDLRPFPQLRELHDRLHKRWELSFDGWVFGSNSTHEMERKESRDRIQCQGQDSWRQILAEWTNVRCGSRKVHVHLRQ